MLIFDRSLSRNILMVLPKQHAARFRSGIAETRKIDLCDRVCLSLPGRQNRNRSVEALNKEGLANNSKKVEVNESRSGVMLEQRMFDKVYLIILRLSASAFVYH